MLVCVGATLITEISSSFGANGDRIAAQVVTGVGFLGAGTILRDTTGSQVHGLTTAASLWAIAAVGIAVGYGGSFAELATVAALIILFTLGTLNHFEDAMIRRRRRQSLTVVFTQSCVPLEALSVLLDALHGKHVRTRDLKLEKMANTEVARIQLTLSRFVQRDDISNLLYKDPNVLHYEWGD